jgi:hypothetical protein
MFTLPAVLALIAGHYTKVHEIWSVLHAFPVMPTLYAAACLGFLLDLRLGLSRAEACPQARLVLPLWMWTLVSVALSGGLGLIAGEIKATMTYMLLFLLIAHGVQTFRALRVMGMSILAISLFLGIVAFVQARNPFSCILLKPDIDPDIVGDSDGRLCEVSAECRADAEAGEEYRCEQPGPFQTMTIGGRVRYRGNLEDPNELALVLVIALPFAMASFAQRLSGFRAPVVATSLGIVLPVVIWTASRTGQLAFIAVVAAYFLERISLKRLIPVAVLAAPALLLGGRSNAGADESAMERLEAWHFGLDMFKSSPVWGIGKSQFVENYYITAHNTFVLEATELGLVGMILWVGVLYTGFKIVVLALRRYRGRADSAVPYEWARALRASLCGIAVGTNFLSLAYHPVIWVYFALPGAFYLATRRHDPEFRVSFGRRDLLAVTGFSIVWLIGIRMYLAAKGA